MAAYREFGSALPRKTTGAGAEAGVEVAASFETPVGFVPSGLQQQRLAQQAPRERFSPRRPCPFCPVENLACVPFDGVGETVTVEVVLPDAMMDVEHAGQHLGRPLIARQSPEFGGETLAPRTGEMPDDGERLVGSSHVVRRAEFCRRDPGLFRVALRCRDVAGLPRGIRPAAQQTCLFGGALDPRLSYVEMRDRPISAMTHQPRVGNLALNASDP